MTIEQKRAVVRLMTVSITLDVLSMRFMKVIIEWNPIVSAGMNLIEYVIVLRGNGAGHAWTPEEDAVVQEMYPYQPRWDILCALPRRTWQAVINRASDFHLTRINRALGAVDIGDGTSIEDMLAMQEYCITQEQIRAGVKAWVGVVTATTINSYNTP
jgi:hypothetical protein